MNFEKQMPPVLDNMSERLLAQTPLHFACYTGDGHLLDTLIGNTLLYNNNCGQAAEACVAALISEEDTINGWTAAHWAAFYGHLSCLMKLNVRSNLGFDTPSHRSNTSPLHLSAQSGSVLCLKWLLQCGSSKNRQDFMGETALHKAAKAGHTDCAIMLVSHGASADIKNHRGLTPADFAEQSNHAALAQHLRRVAEETECNGMTKSESVPDPVSNYNELVTTPFLKQHTPVDAAHKRCPDTLLLTKDEQNFRHSNIFMNGEDILNTFSAESCDMDQGDSEIILTSSVGDDSLMFSSSWKKKRSFNDLEDDLHSYKRRCSAPSSQKDYEKRYGDAYNNNIISSYNAVLAMQVDPTPHKTLTGVTSKPASPVLQQSSMMEHEATVIAQQGYDSTFMNSMSNAFH